jgi:hypothetical protein
MPTITADKVLNQNIYAKSKVDALKGDYKTVIKTFSNDQRIGNVFSYVETNDGLYWLLYDNYNKPFYVKHDASKIRLEGISQILENISLEQEKNKLKEKGIVQYNIDKYIPYIIGAGVVAIALPTVLAQLKTKKVAGMKPTKETKIILGIGAAVALYFLYKKKRTAGVPIIKDLPNEIAPALPSTIETVMAENVMPPQPNKYKKIDYVGPFEVTYINAIAGARGNLGKIKTF